MAHASILLLSSLRSVKKGPPEEKESEKPTPVVQSPRSYHETNQLIQALSDFQPESSR